MKKTIIITFLFGLISALSTYLLFDSMEGFRKEVKESKIALKEMTQQVNSIETNYKQQIGYWIQKNTVLQRRIQQTNLELERSRMKEKSMQGKILSLISESKTLTDTFSIVSNCDTLKEKVAEFIVQTNIKDSLCQAEITDLKTVIQNQDSMVVVCQSSFSMLKQVTDSSFAMQSRLTDDLNRASKQLRNEKRRSKLLTAGVMILSGATTFLLLQK
ncbi:MAG: hypothetical protein IT233_10555 [Bacteroidia bacterium]|nr:hypothetical protein [Bacteroidia bacterium]